MIRIVKCKKLCTENTQNDEEGQQIERNLKCVEAIAPKSINLTDVKVSFLNS